MLQHLLNTTAIWLISLLLFDILLRRETYHKYNRIYLLATFALGLLLPAIDWLSISAIDETVTASRPLQQLATAKQQVIQTASIPEAVVPTQAVSISYILDIVWCCYVAGALISTTVLIREALLLYRLYRKGRKTHIRNWTLVETGKDHGPFSFASYLFVQGREKYTNEQWQIIPNHERQHTKLMHWIDNAALQVVSILFWFHPLVYAYGKRIRLLHEYQADVVGTEMPSKYGAFLIQQSMLQTAPAITHSFNRSPIKNRIMMLTRSASHKTHITKMLVVLPLLATCFVCCSKTEEAAEKKGGIAMTPTKPAKTIEVNGNKIRFSQEGKFDGPGNLDMYVYARPEQLNGKRIYDESEDATEPVTAETGQTLKEYVLSQLRIQLSSREDGIYFTNVNNIVIDENGTIVYYEVARDDQGLLKIKDADKDLANSANEIFEHLPKMKPAMLHGKPVPYAVLSLMEPTNYMRVKMSNVTQIDTMNEKMVELKF
ncbi:MAG: hypothetical protein EOO06_00520 [Chitinophagaceae bacterium]|nr:MAG: hypothetical protein EOO06_00520 [Chitinophagaceae bacterium]